MLTRVADGRAAVVAAIRAAGPLMADLAAPVPARGPWLTAALNVQPSGPLARVRTRAVLVERETGGRYEAAALLSLRRRGATTAVTLLGSEPALLPEGQPPARLLARDPEAAARLAEGLAGLLAGLRGPWTLRLAGLPLGDPTLASLGALLPDSQLSTSRSRWLVDELDTVAEVHRTADPAGVERALPAVLAAVPAPARAFLRAAARLHAAIGQLEVAVVPGPTADRPAAVLLTLLDGAERWPWWGTSEVGGLRRELGSPWVALTASAGLLRLGRPVVSYPGSASPGEGSVSSGTAAG